MSVAEKRFPILEPPDQFGIHGDESVAGLILAAGTSSRFGPENKLLIEIGDIPVVKRSAQTLVESQIDPVFAVIGHDSERIKHILADLPINVIQNPKYEQGQATSVAAGVQAVPDDGDAVIIALGDMPFVSPRTINRLIATYRSRSKMVLAAAYGGKRGNPVLFDARFFDDLTRISGDRGGRRILLEADHSALVETGDPGVVKDIDVPEDISE